MKKLSYVLAAAVLILGGILIYTIKENKKVTEKWKTAMANVKAYSDELGLAKKNNTAYQFRIDQLEYLQDSVLTVLDDTRKELGIKDKQLKSMQYVSSSFSKVDTITITQVDTLFKEPSLAMDTLVGDEWYSVKLGLKYPSTIVVEPEFKSEKHIIVSNKRETVDPPKKFFLLRWFQKKHTVLNIDVVEKNPYVKDDHSKFVEIIK